MRACDSEALNGAVGERVNNVAGRDFAHRFVERIDLIVAFAFGRPDVFPEELVPEGLTMIDPPVVHADTKLCPTERCFLKHSASGLNFLGKQIGLCTKLNNQSKP